MWIRVRLLKQFQAAFGKRGKSPQIISLLHWLLMSIALGKSMLTRAVVVAQLEERFESSHRKNYIEYLLSSVLKRRK